MEDKKFNEILQDYAQSEKTSSDRAFAKLKRENARVPKKKQFKPLFLYAATLTLIIVTLCVALPLAFQKQNSLPQGGEDTTTYFNDNEVTFNVEENLLILKQKYEITAMFPFFDEESASIFSITAQNHKTLKGAQIGFVVDADHFLKVKFVTIPKEFMLKSYKEYLELPQQTNWRDYAVKSSVEYKEKEKSYLTKLYFVDDKYNYFLSVESDNQTSVTEILKMLYV